MIEFTIKTLDSNNHHFSVDDELTIEQLKERVKEQMGIEPHLQRLIFCGRVMQDEKKLREYGVNGKVVHLVQRAPPDARQSTASASNDNERGERSDRNDRRDRPERGALGFHPPGMQQQMRRLMSIPTAPDHMEQQPQSPSAGRLEFIRRAIVDIKTTLAQLRAHINDEERSGAPASSEAPVEPMDNEPTPVATQEEPEPVLDDNGDEVADPLTRAQNARRRSYRAIRALRARCSRPRDLAQLIDELDSLHEQFVPYRNNYVRILREANDHTPPEYTEEEREHNQVIMEMASDIMHSFAHAYHSISDLSFHVGERNPVLDAPSGRSPMPVSAQINVVQNRQPSAQQGSNDNAAGGGAIRRSSNNGASANPTNSGENQSSAAATSAGRNTTQPTVNINIQPDPVTYQVEIETRVPIAFPIDNALLNGLSNAANTNNTQQTEPNQQNPSQNQGGATTGQANRRQVLFDFENIFGGISQGASAAGVEVVMSVEEIVRATDRAENPGAASGPPGAISLQPAGAVGVAHTEGGGNAPLPIFGGNIYLAPMQWGGGPSAEILQGIATTLVRQGLMPGIDSVALHVPGLAQAIQGQLEAQVQLEALVQAHTDATTTLTNNADTQNQTPAQNQPQSQNNSQATNESTSEAQAQNTTQAQDNAQNTTQAQDNAQNRVQAQDNAQNRAQVQDNAQNRAQVQDNTQNGAQVQDNAQNSAQVRDNAQNTAQVADNAQNGAQVPDSVQNRAEAQGNAQSRAQVQDNALNQGATQNEASAQNTNSTSNQARAQTQNQPRTNPTRASGPNQQRQLPNLHLRRAAAAGRPYATVANFLYDRFLHCDSIYARRRIQRRRDQYQQQLAAQERIRVDRVAAVNITSLRDRSTSMTETYINTMVHLLHAEPTPETWYNALMVAVARNLFIPEPLQMIGGEPPLVPSEFPALRRQMRSYVQDLLDRSNADGENAFEGVADFLLNENSDFINNMRTVTPILGEIDVRGSVRMLVRSRLPAVVACVMSDSPGEAFAPRFYGVFSRLFIDACALITLCCRDGILGLRALFTAYVEEILQDFEEPIRDMLLTLSIDNLNGIMPNLRIHANNIRQFIQLRPRPAQSSRRSIPMEQSPSPPVRDEPMPLSEGEPPAEPAPLPVLLQAERDLTPLEHQHFPLAAEQPARRGLAVPLGSTQEAMDIVPDGPGPASASTSGDLEPADATTSPSTQASCSSQEQSTSPDPANTLPRTTTEPPQTQNQMVTPDLLLNHWAPQWIPVLMEDQRAQRDEPTEPYSDAYISGMPARKRRCIRDARPPTTLEGFINESVCEAAERPAVMDSSSIRTAFREHMRNMARARASNSNDFDPLRYASAARFLNPPRSSKQQEQPDSTTDSEDK